MHHNNHSIGIFGGSFNPCHLGHLNIARIALNQYRLDKLLFIPCKVSPFKTSCSPDLFVDDIHRMKMIELTIAGYDKFEACPIEINRGGVSYSYDTVVSIKKKIPDSKLFFIIGSDTLLTLSQWYKIHALLTICEFVTVARPSVEKILNAVPGFSAAQSSHLTENRITGRQLDISSSEIRRKVVAGESIGGLVDSKVADYIKENNLYFTNQRDD